DPGDRHPDGDRRQGPRHPDPVPDRGAHALGRWRRDRDRSGRRSVGAAGLEGALADRALAVRGRSRFRVLRRHRNLLRLLPGSQPRAARPDRSPAVRVAGGAAAARPGYNRSIVAMKGIADLARRIDPRRSVAARLLLAFLLTSLIPGALFVLVLERRLTDLHESSVDRLSAVQKAEAAIRINQDVSYRAEWVDRRVKVVEETAWALAEEVRLALTEPALAARPLPAPDGHGHLWNRAPESDTVGFLSKARAKD